MDASVPKISGRRTLPSTPSGASTGSKWYARLPRVFRDEQHGRVARALKLCRRVVRTQDWCNSKPQDPKTTYPKMSKALNASGRAIHFNMCEWGLENPWEWGFDCAQSWRMGGDHTGTWASTKSVIQNVMKIPAQYTGKPYGWNDMDMLEGGNGLQAAHANGKEGTLTLAESITEYTMWAIAASPLVITTPIMNCTAKQASEDWSAKHAVVDTEGSSGERRSTVEGAAAAEVKLGKPPSGPPSPPNPPKHNCKGMLNDIQKVTLLNKEVVSLLPGPSEPLLAQSFGFWSSVRTADTSSRLSARQTDCGQPGRHSARNACGRRGFHCLGPQAHWRRRRGGFVQ